MADDPDIARAQIAAQIQSSVRSAAPADPLALARSRYPGYAYVPGELVRDSHSGEIGTVIHAHRTTFHSPAAESKTS